MVIIDLASKNDVDRARLFACRLHYALVVSPALAHATGDAFTRLVNAAAQLGLKGVGC